MKRVLFVAAAVLLTGAMAFADEVSQYRAEQLANVFFGNPSSKVKYSPSIIGNQGAAPSYYIFNNPDGGWVVISGEDSTYPVLAYSTQSYLEESMMNDAVRYWFDGLAQDIRNAREAGLEPDDKIKAAWNAVGSRRKTEEKCLTTALWGQGSPFNDHCPSIPGEGGRSVSGCVATAMAIVLRYHGYPDRGKGTIGDYNTSKGYHIDSYSIGSHEYHISEIPLDSHTYNWTADQKSYVAELVHDCGVMVQMDYSYNGSGAFSVDILPALQEHMGYSRKATYLYRYLFKTRDWIVMLKSEIDAGRPVLYSGADSYGGGGHQFVVDGYDADNNMHINWGWNGACNGFFSLDYLGDNEDVGYVFNVGQDAIFGLAPDPEGNSGESEVVLYLETYDSPGGGISLSSGTIAKGSTFTLKFEYIWNTLAYEVYNGYIRAGVIDYKEELKEYIGSQKQITAEYGYGYSFSYTATLTKDIAPGDRIVLFYTDRAGSWKRMPADRSGDTVAEYPLVDACFISLEDSYRAGDIFVFDLITGLEAISEVVWYYDGLRADGYEVVLTSGTHSIEARIKYSAGDTETIRQSIVVE